MEFLPEKIAAYAEAYTQAEPSVLSELVRETHLTQINPRMLSGHLQGRFLALMSRLVSPNRILEIGTYTGYATICLAEGLSTSGHIDTIDINEELTHIQHKYFDKAGIGSQVSAHFGDATAIIPQLPNRYQLVFIDADKENYATYLDLVIDKVDRGGLIIADNVLWSGKVVESPLPNDTETAGIIKFNNHAFQHPELKPILLPLRDGLMICQKQ